MLFCGRETAIVRKDFITLGRKPVFVGILVEELGKGMSETVRKLSGAIVRETTTAIGGRVRE